jgi:uncharacterized protein
MSEKNKSRLRFNLGFLLESDLGTRREIELSYPSVRVSDDVELRPLQGKFQVTHTSKGLYVHGLLESAVNAECTRCLDPVYLPITLELDDLYYHPPSSAPEGEFTIGEDGILDLSPLLRELSLLAIPMQVYCREDCRGICVECGQNLNHGPCKCELEQIDPRLEALRKLMDA